MPGITSPTANPLFSFSPAFSLELPGEGEGADGELPGEAPRHETIGNGARP
jgi:hypothetical protein